MDDQQHENHLLLKTTPINAFLGLDSFNVELIFLKKPKCTCFTSQKNCGDEVTIWQNLILDRQEIYQYLSIAQI